MLLGGSRVGVAWRSPLLCSQRGSLPEDWPISVPRTAPNQVQKPGKLLTAAYNPPEGTNASPRQGTSRPRTVTAAE